MLSSCLLTIYVTFPVETLTDICSPHKQYQWLTTETILPSTTLMNQWLWFSRLVTGLWMSHKPLQHQKSYPITDDDLTELLHEVLPSVNLFPVCSSTSKNHVWWLGSQEKHLCPIPLLKSVNSTTSVNTALAAVVLLCLFHCHSYGSKVISSSWYWWDIVIQAPAQWREFDCISYHIRSMLWFIVVSVPEPQQDCGLLCASINLPIALKESLKKEATMHI